MSTSARRLLIRAIDHYPIRTLNRRKYRRKMPYGHLFMSTSLSAVLVTNKKEETAFVQCNWTSLSFPLCQ
ncbi:MAG: hypothetical protein LKF47_04250 [Megasphaera sp.]|nr:hypothetical protein [Megasphaera sp.]MCI1248020.1 hypothetical protein [Megasphaera sp.]